jgi:hypothetical protein
MNPAAAVRGPKHVIKKGKTPVLTADEARQLLDSIDTRKIVGLRDRALIGVMVYSFARVSAALSMTVADYFPQGRRMWFRLHEKGGKLHDVPAHHNAEKYLDAYMNAAGLWDQKRSPLFRTVDRPGRLTERPMLRTNVLDMVKRRAQQADVSDAISCHTFRPPASPLTWQTAGHWSTRSKLPLTSPPEQRNCTTARTTRSVSTKSSGLSSEKAERAANNAFNSRRCGVSNRSCQWRQVAQRDLLKRGRRIVVVLGLSPDQDLHGCLDAFYLFCRVRPDLTRRFQLASSR